MEEQQDKIVKIKIMQIYKDNEELDFTQIHTSKFEIIFNKKIEDLQNIVEVEFSSISQLKGNKDLLELAFNAELNDN